MTIASTFLYEKFENKRHQEDALKDSGGARSHDFVAHALGTVHGFERSAAAALALLKLADVGLGDFQ
ncbi:hypothetical protein ABTE34_21390, partial [Acinetobacter baumannii]